MKNRVFCHEGTDFLKKLSVNFTLQTVSEVKDKRLRRFIIQPIVYT